MDAANFVFDHPLGPIYGWFSPEGLRALKLPPEKPRRARMNVLHSSANDARVWALQTALERYFAGVRQDFAEVPLDLSDGTEFQRAVWEGARAFGWGDRSTYGGLAAHIGKPKAARAVGQALGRNPVPIIVPCHRFLAAGGKLGGFSAGLHWKRELLRVEGGG
jgi:methylated-DNA-[protein]-cysteine S-methyltransferase